MRHLVVPKRRQVERLACAHVNHDGACVREQREARQVRRLGIDTQPGHARAASVAAQLRARAAGGGEDAEDRAVADALRPLLPASVVDYVVLNKLYRAKA